MKQLNDEYDHLFKGFIEDENIDSKDFGTILEILKEKVEHSSKICQIVDFEKLIQVYFNKAATHFFDVSNETLQQLGFQYTLHHNHPEHYNTINRYVNHFSDKENNRKPLYQVNYVKSKYGWRWLYNYSTVVALTKDGHAKYIVVKGIDVSSFLESDKNKTVIKKDDAFITQNQSKYDLLSAREKLIIQLIVAEKSSVDIAELLEISPATVDTHRYNILQKLGVRSSVGLVKYVYMFDMK